jgi:hypothetical protein
MSIEHLKIKSASLASVIPAAAGPAIGGLAGRALGAKFLGPVGGITGAELGTALGGTTGAVGGQMIKERVEDLENAAQQQAMPMGAPYAIDSTSEDIPAWALQGAQLLRPHLKTAGPMDWLLGEVPGAPMAQAAIGAEPGQRLPAAGKAFAGMAGGGVGGAALGMGVGMGLERLLHMNPNYQLPFLHMKPHELLGALGGSIGATKGFRHMVPEQG